eukprot:GHRR01008011.1.p1 GENE.GHRR01008011.1~~GHRR01008011.1.p1  ORF type:complete len:773 (+),score=293.49 GHRR01008011.1:254-2572(+)
MSRLSPAMLLAVLLSTLVLNATALQQTPQPKRQVDLPGSTVHRRRLQEEAHDTEIAVYTNDTTSDNGSAADSNIAAVPATSSEESQAAKNTTTSIAEAIDKALAKEFEQDIKDVGSGKTFNETVANEEGKVETVVRISSKGRDDSSTSSSTTSSTTSSSSDTSQTGSGDSSTSKSASTSGQAAAHDKQAAADKGTQEAAATQAAAPKPSIPQLDKGVDRIIDSQDNEFVLSAPNDLVATLTLDPLLIQDLTFLFASAAVMGMVFESLKQPVINGYLVAGAMLGPGGLQLIKELVQVESLAQLGVQLLLFNLGRELSIKKLKSVWSVALLGGSLQIIALMLLGGLVAAAVESNVTQGVFVGALLSMSSTSVVVKCLEASRTNASAYGQITIGTLILQDCSVGLMFALMPAFGTAAASSEDISSSPTGAGNTSAEATSAAVAAAFASSARAAALVGVATLVAKVLLKLVVVLAAAMTVARTILPKLLHLLLRHASKELVQLSLVGMCLSSAWLCGQLGLSEELGAFITGAMISIAEQQLVASGFLFAAHGQSLSPTAAAATAQQGDSGPGTPIKAAVGHNAAAKAYYHGALERSSSLEPLKSQGSGVLLPEGLPLHALQRQLSGHLRAAAAGGAGLENTVSVCANIESITNVLTALFVASMGLIMSPVFLLHHALVLLLGTAVVTLVKAVVVTAVVRLFGVPVKLSLAVGLSMAHIGEFSFVLLSMANQLKLLSSQVGGRHNHHIHAYNSCMTAMAWVLVPAIVTWVMHRHPLA